MPVTDDKQLVIVRRDISGGQNNRQHGANIRENQATVLKNADIGVPGETKKRPGITLIEDISNDAGIGLFGFIPSGGTNELMALHGTDLSGWIGSGSFTDRKTDFVNGTPTKMIKAGESGEDDVLLIYVEGNNWFRMNQSHAFQDLGNTSGTASDSPPLSPVGTYFRNRFWVLKDNLLYYSDAFPADYSTAFDTVSGNYRLDVGEERALIPIRDQGLIAMGEDAIWGVNPSVTPAATDKPEKLLDIGCVSNKTAVQVGDDILFLASDGVRGLFRTQQDKLQAGASIPLSYVLKEEFESISWVYISSATAVFFDNKYFIALPVDASTYNNEVWVYYPATQAWTVITGWNVGDWAKMKTDGEELLYFIDNQDGKVYEAWKGFDDNGAAIDFEMQGRKEDFGQPLVFKNGGEVKVRMLSSGNYNVTVSASADDKAFVTLGTINLQGNAPTLPVSLPFDLADTDLVEESFHLDSLGPFRQLRVKIKHNDTNGSDDIIVYEQSMVTFAEEYQSE